MSETERNDNLGELFAEIESVLVLGRGPSALDVAESASDYDAVMVADPTYALQDVYAGIPFAVFVGDRSLVLSKVALRYKTALENEKPVLLFAYLPFIMKEMPPDFEKIGLPSPLPVLPLLRDAGLYEYSGMPYPTTGTFMAMTVAALGKRVHMAGVDLYRHPSGRTYGAHEEHLAEWPPEHSEAVEVEHIRRVAVKLGERFTCTGVAAEVL